MNTTANRMQTRTRKAINRELAALATNHEFIPVSDINDILKKHGVELLQEDGTPWSGFICGEAGHTSFDIGCANAVLVLMWYRMLSGRYEITAYLS